MFKTIKKLFRALRETEALHGLLTWQPVQHFIWPLVGPVIAAVLGIAGNVPLLWVWVSALASFAFLTHGLLRLNEWIDRTSADGKLDIVEPTIWVSSDESSDPIEIEGVQIGVTLSNRALFPMEFTVDKIDTRFADRVGTTKNFANKGGVIAPNSASHFRDSAIQMNPPRPILERKAYDGQIDVTISYGKLGGRRFLVQRNFSISAFIDPTTKEMHINWRWI
ncbi:hypothetical protein [Aurantimonas sp. HBX-1]|uniref:hypothetical protein n=1 Tax=Aurantimonas sp. HBX-1 TaxID=2906072 RepID=UPI001F289D02|nr:hypothetical protein [Aurantimonas sp. HBX-1]UIJ71172.1 hypothetical protein LXB15_15835 [Aurantimonas sp. HBX-1]